MDPSGSQRIREDLWGTKCRKLSETGASRSFGSWRIAADIPMPWRRDPVDPRSTRSTWLPSTCAMYCHSVLWFLLISMISVDFYWFLLISIDFYWFLWSLHPTVDVQKHSKPSITIPWSSTGWLIQVVSDFPPICHGNFGEFRHMLQHLAHLPKHPQIICFLLCLWCLCSYLINIIKHDTL